MREQVEQALRATIEAWVDEQNRLWRGEALPGDAVSFAVTEDFRAQQFAPWYDGGVWHGDRAAWIDGTLDAARSVASGGPPWTWTVRDLQLLIRSTDEAVACYRVDLWRGDRDRGSSIFLETWRFVGGRWTLFRHTAEKAAPLPQGS